MSAWNELPQPNTTLAYTVSPAPDLARALVLLALLFGAILSSAQGEFSADLVDLQQPGDPVLAKVSFGTGKRRFDMEPASGPDTIIVDLKRPTATMGGTHLRVGGSGDSIIVDLVNHTSTVLWPQEKLYHRAPYRALSPAELYGLYANVQATDVDKACDEWMKRPAAQGETCANVGKEEVNGRETVKYNLSCYGEVCHLWIDRKLRVLVKRETKWNRTELRNIREGAQPANLFEVPAGYAEKATLNGIIRSTEPQ
jgi:hypothetical protein